MTALTLDAPPKSSVSFHDNDPLLSKLAMPLRAIFYPLGFAVEIMTNEQAILDAARESWGHLQQRQTKPALRLHIGIVGDQTVGCPPTPVVRAQRHLLSVVADANNHAVCDLKSGFAVVWLNRAILQHTSYLRYHFIEAVTLVLISTSYATAIHAACVSRNGYGVLLCGDSGAGKSSLAYACARAGWTYTSDDASYLLHDANRPHVIGASHQLRFRPSARELFPELKDRNLTPRVEGKPSIVVPTSELPGLIGVDETDIHSIVFLNRQSLIRTELLPFSKAIALQYFHQTLYSVEEVYQRQANALKQLVTAEVYELRYQTFDQAIGLLEKLTDCQGISSM